MGARLVLEGLRSAGRGFADIGQAATDYQARQAAEEDRQRKIDEEERIKILRGEIFSPTTMTEQEVAGPPDVSTGETNVTAQMEGPSLLGELKQMSSDVNTTREEFSAKAGEYLAQAAATGDVTTITAARNIIDQLEEPITVRETRAEKEAERQGKKDRTALQAKVKQEIAKNKLDAEYTPGEIKVDRDFSADYLDWETAGGAERMQKDLSTLDAVITKLKDPRADVTGKVVGSTPEWLRGFVNPDAQDTHDNIRQVIQQTLRLTLGSAFTEKEGERVINATYNPKLPPETNAKRIQALFDQLQRTARTKQAAVEYYRNNRSSLRGFRKPEDIEKEFLKSIGLGEKKETKQGSQTPETQTQTAEAAPKMKVIDMATFEKMRQNPKNQAMFAAAKAKAEAKYGPLSPEQLANAEMEILKQHGITVQR